MPKYKCQNPKCIKYSQVQTVFKSKSFIQDGEIVDSGSICPKCENIMESINPVGFTTFITGSENICKK